MTQSKWEKLSSKQLLKHARLNVYEDEVRLPSGHKTTYIHFGKSPDAACVIAVDSKGKILLQQEYSYPPNDWLYQLPGGALDSNETPLEGASRELAEEASLAGKLEELGWMYADNRRKNSRFYVFLATDLHKTKGIKDVEEEFEYSWHTEAEIDSMIKNGQVVNYSLLAGWAFYKAKKV